MYVIYSNRLFLKYYPRLIIKTMFNSFLDQAEKPADFLKYVDENTNKLNRILGKAIRNGLKVILFLICVFFKTFRFNY